LHQQSRGWSAFADHDESAGGSVNLFGSWYSTSVSAVALDCVVAKWLLAMTG
jgi:hypothetical protein